jgi:subtilase family protein
MRAVTSARAAALLVTLTGLALAAPPGAARAGLVPRGGLTRVCPPPAHPGQMTCMALLPAGTPAPAGRAYGPAALQEAYHLRGPAMTPPAGGTDTVAVVDAYNDPRAAADLAVYRAAYGLPACSLGTGCLTVTAARGGRRPKSDPGGAWELEESLDLDMVSAICPYCKILLVQARSDALASLAAAERYAVRHASVVSDSWGSGAEFRGEAAFDADFRRPGVAVVAAAGDDGYGTQFPAASPYVTAVGGTRLAGATATRAGRQTAWSGTGAGCSRRQPQPAWQAIEPGVARGCRGRVQNDVAAVADPDPGVAVYDSVRYRSGSGTAVPGWIAMGGTSAATPIIAAAYALADISTGRPGTGLVPGTWPASYPYRHPADFTDVTAGSSSVTEGGSGGPGRRGRCAGRRRYLCQAGRGYDGPTGLGAPRGLAGLRGPGATAAAGGHHEPATAAAIAAAAAAAAREVRP